MKFRVTMKDPDTLIDAVNDAVAESIKGLGLDDGERAAVAEKRAEKTLNLCGKWFGYSEYLTVEIDTDAMTCVVIPDEK